MSKKSKAIKKPEFAQEKLGLGDAIEKVTKKTGVKKIVKAFNNGKDCQPCEERKNRLNKIRLPIRHSVKRCFTEDQYEAFKEYANRRTLKSWKREDVQFLVDLYAHVFAIQYNSNNLCSNCQGSAKILLKIDEHLDKLYQDYK